MSIRKKLFFAFFLVAAISSASLLLLARSYVADVHARLDRQFLDDARAAFRSQDVQAGLTQQYLFETVTGLARDPGLLQTSGDSEILVHRWVTSSEVLPPIVVWDAAKREIVRTIGRGAQEPLTPARVAALVAGPRGVRNGFEVVTDGGAASEEFAIARIGSEEAPRGYVLAPLDSRRFCMATTFGRDGKALLVDGKSGELWHAPDDVAAVRESLPGIARVLASRPPHGETADVDDGHGRRYRIYSAVSGETPLLLFNGSVEAFALEPLDELYAPLATIRVRVLASVAITLVLALAAALLLSGRFVGDIERIRRAVAAFAQGDWRRLEKSSRDELGGALVDSINDMALAVADRMRRDEAESWRSLIRVVSHEINNTLAPIRSVAASLRTGLLRRLRADDAGADVDMALKLIVERVDALATFIDGYAEVAKLPPPRRRPSDVRTLLAGAAALFAERAADAGLTLAVDGAGGGVAELDAQQLERVLVNVVKNAIEASPAGGVVAMRAGRAAGSLEITVADDGPGISPEAQRNLFVPYFSTKPDGSGIGLALARQIVVAHGGTITAERSDSGGTLVRIVIPDAAPAHPYREATPAE